MRKSIDIKNKIQEDKTLKIAPFRKDVRITAPHKHKNYFEIIYLTKGSGFHFIDSQRYEVVPNSVFIIRNEQMHHWNLKSEPDGYVIIIKKKFAEQCIDKEIKSLLYQLSLTNHMLLRNTGVIDKLLAILCEEKDPVDRLSGNVTEGLLKTVLAKILSEGSLPPIHRRKIGNGLYHHFTDMLSQEKKLMNSVSYYAEILNTSPQNLNQACRKAGSLSASEVIAEFIINEAKRYLVYTDKTVAEIAFDLNFNDPSHFSKYFKRFTGSTPHQYREAF